MKTSGALGALFCLIGVSFFSKVAYGDEVEKSVTINRFGKVAIYGDALNAKQTFLFLSGDGGWNLGVIDMARILSQEGNLVLGVDVRSLLKTINNSKGKCAYPASDLEGISKAVQKKLGVKNYQVPVIVGYSSGASLAYVALAQAPENTFAGAISLGFCPDLAITKMLCKGNGLSSSRTPKKKEVVFKPSKKIAKPWIVLQGDTDKVCSSKSTSNFVSKIPQGHFVALPTVGHGFSQAKKWEPQLKQAIQTYFPTALSTEKEKTNEDIADLSLEEVTAGSTDKDIFGIFLTGDGGWASLDKGISAEFAAKGIPIVGFNMLKYLWDTKTPAQAAKDLERIIQVYSSKWKKNKFLLIGYSAGADIAAFMMNRLENSVFKNSIGVALLAPSTTASFEFHLSDWISNEASAGNPEVMPEIKNMVSKKIKILCLYGKGEATESLCPKLPEGLATVIGLAGSHHFGGEYSKIAKIIASYFKIIPDEVETKTLAK